MGDLAGGENTRQASSSSCCFSRSVVENSERYRSRRGCEWLSARAVILPEDEDEEVIKKRTDGLLETRRGTAEGRSNGTLATSLAAADLDAEAMVSQSVNDRSTCSALGLAVKELSVPPPVRSLEMSALLSPHPPPVSSLALGGQDQRGGEESRDVKYGIKHNCSPNPSQSEHNEPVGANDCSPISACEQLAMYSEDGWGGGTAMGFSSRAALNPDKKGAAFVFSFPTFAQHGGASSLLTPRWPCRSRENEAATTHKNMNCDLLCGPSTNGSMQEGRDLCSHRRNSMHSCDNGGNASHLSHCKRLPKQQEEKQLDSMSTRHTTTSLPQIRIPEGTSESCFGAKGVREHDTNAYLIPPDYITPAPRASRTSDGKVMQSLRSAMHSHTLDRKGDQLRTHLWSGGVRRMGITPRMGENNSSWTTGEHSGGLWRNVTPTPTATPTAGGVGCDGDCDGGTSDAMTLSPLVKFHVPSEGSSDDTQDNVNSSTTTWPLEQSAAGSKLNLSLSSTASSMGAMAFASYSTIDSGGGYHNLLLPRVLPLSVPRTATEEELQQQQQQQPNCYHLPGQNGDISFTRMQRNTNEVSSLNLKTSHGAPYVTEVPSTATGSALTAVNDPSVAMSESLDALFNVVDVPMELRMRPGRLFDAAELSPPLLGTAVVVSNPMNFTIHSDILPSTLVQESSHSNNRNNTSDLGESTLGSGFPRKLYSCRFSEHFGAAAAAAAAASMTIGDRPCSAHCLQRSAVHPFHCRGTHSIREVGVMTTSLHERTCLHLHGDSLRRDASDMWSPLRNPDVLALSNNPLEFVICCGGSVALNSQVDGGGGGSGATAQWDMRSCSSPTFTCSSCCCTRWPANGPVVVSSCSFRLPTFGCPSPGR